MLENIIELKRAEIAAYKAIKAMSNEELKQVIKSYKKLWNFAKAERSLRRRKGKWKSQK